jgi:hypothetical protein
MTDPSVMQGYIREANPIPDVEHLDAEELVRFVAVANMGGDTVQLTATLTPARPVPLVVPLWRHRVWAFALGLVVLLASVGIVALVVRFDGASVTDEPPIVTIAPAPGSDSPHPYNAVEALEFAPGGYLWAATSGGVVGWDLATGDATVFGEADGIPSAGVIAVDAAPDGTIWVAGDGWIGRYDGSWQVFSSANTPELDSQIGGMAVDSDGVVWVDVASEGPLRYDGTWTQIDSPPGGILLHSLSVAPDGTLWGSGLESESGVLTYDGTAWHRLTDGVPGATSNIAFAADGSVWFGSGRPGATADGIARFDGFTWTTFTMDDGLLANAGSVVAAAGGDVWVVHDEGLSRFDGSAWAAIDLGENFAGAGAGAVVADDGTLWMPGAAGIVGFDGTDTTTLIVPPEIATQRWSAITLTPIATEEPPRISTVIGDFEFSTMQLPTGHSFFFTEATAHGPVVTEGFDVLRWSTDGVTWDGVLPTVDPWRITTDAGDVIVHGDGYARYAWDGDAWIEVSTVGLPGPARHLALGPRGAVAVIDDVDHAAYHGTDVYYAADGVNFAKAEAGPNPELLTGDSLACVQSGPSSPSDPPRSQIGPVLATEAGFVVLTPAHPVNWSRLPACEPLLWFSDNGNRWDLVSSQSPFGEGALVHRIAEHAGRYVAVGAVPSESVEGAVWVSDDALTWQRADVDMEAAVGVAGGDLGWIVTGHAIASTSDLAGVDMWFSVDGLTWDGPHQGPGELGTVYFLSELAVGSDVIYGVGGTHDTYIIGRLQE